MLLKDLNNKVLNQMSNDMKVNVFSLPKVEKIVVSVGLGPNKDNKELIGLIGKELALITGQKPKETKAKKSISGFKIREGQHIGYTVTVRGDRMWQFLSRIINIVLPRIRDFDGISDKSIDNNGNLNFSVKEQISFPEIKPDEVKSIWGMTITVSLDKKTDPKVAKAYYSSLGFIFKSER